MNWSSFFRFWHIAFTIDWLTQQIEQTTKTLLADWNINWFTRVTALHATNKTIGRVHRNTANNIVTNVLGYFNNKCSVVRFILNADCVENIWQVIGIEFQIDCWSNYLNNLSIIIGHDLTFSLLKSAGAANDFT